jgi:hypothetical protein
MVTYTIASKDDPIYKNGLTIMSYSKQKESKKDTEQEQKPEPSQKIKIKPAHR